MDEPQVESTDAHQGSEPAPKLGHPAPAPMAGGGVSHAAPGRGGADPRRADAAETDGGTHHGHGDVPRRPTPAQYAAYLRGGCGRIFPALDGSLGALVGFVRWLELHAYASTTVESRLTGALVGLRGYGVPVSRQASAREEIRNYRRRLAAAQPIGAEHLRALVRGLPRHTGRVAGAGAAADRVHHRRPRLRTGLSRLRRPRRRCGPRPYRAHRVHEDRHRAPRPRPALWQADPDTCAVRAWHT